MKEAAGKVLGDKKLETEGKTDKAAGKVQNAKGGLKVRCAASRPAPSKETSHGINSDYRSIIAPVCRRRRLLGSQSRLLVTKSVLTFTREQGRLGHQQR